MIRRVVLTGGPGAGKTVVSAQIAAGHPSRFVRVPEAATQIYEALQTRWDRLNTQERRDVQRRIYQLQIDQEETLAIKHPDQTLLLDRGTIDGAAYWPEGAEEYWRVLGTSSAREMARYDEVIWLESCAALGLYDGDQSNTCRFEDAGAAVESGQRLLQLWAAHPNLKQVPAFVKLQDKIQAVEKLLNLS